MPNITIPIAWGVFWPIIQFPGCFFCSIWYPVILVIFDPKNTHFQTHLDLELHLDGAEKCPTYLSPLLGLCFGPLSSFQVDIFAQYGILPFWLFFYPQNHPFLDPPGPGMAPGWGIKVSQAFISIVWGVFWSIFLFPGIFFCSIWRPVILAVFYP